VKRPTSADDVCRAIEGVRDAIAAGPSAEVRAAAAAEIGQTARRGGTGAGAVAPGLIFGCREQFFACHLL